RLRRKGSTPARGEREGFPGSWPTSVEDVAQRSDETVGDRFVELRAGAFSNPSRCIFLTDRRRVIRVARSHGYPGVTYLDHSRGYGDGVAADSAGIALAVDALVVPQHGLRHLLAQQRLDDCRPHHRVLAQAAKFFRGETRPPVQPLVIEKAKTNVVHQPGDASGLDLLRLQTEKLR